MYFKSFKYELNNKSQPSLALAFHLFWQGECHSLNGLIGSDESELNVLSELFL